MTEHRQITVTSALRRLIANASLGLAVVSAVAVGGGPASAGPGVCSLDTTTHIATAGPYSEGNSYIGVVRSGDNLIIDGETCGTVTTVKEMHIDLGDSGTVLEFSLSGGPFAPGFGAEPNGTSEIEFVVNAAPLSFPTISVEGSTDDDTITIGSFLDGPSLEMVEAINLNAGLEGGNEPIDSDVTIRARLREHRLRGKGGDDTLSGAGLGTFGTRPSGETINFYDEIGADTMIGGNASDRLYHGDEDEGDVFDGGPGEDQFYSERLEGVTLSQDGEANDGSDCPSFACEEDNVMNMEFIRTGGGADFISGGPGPQGIDPGLGNNILRGGSGADHLIIFVGSSSGVDEAYGGKGRDTGRLVFPFSPPEGTTTRVSLDDNANDGVAGDGDNVHDDIEILVGTEARDVLIGNSRANELLGEEGNDTLRGLGGRDTLNGGTPGLLQSGDDELFGGGGVDTASITAGFGGVGGSVISLDDERNDRVDGRSDLGVDNVHSDIENLAGTDGPDKLRGSERANLLEGADGDDILRGLGGPDRLLGGPGDDTLDGGPGSDVCRGGPGPETKAACES